MYTELWVSRGELKECGNPGAAFDEEQMRHMFDMPNGILLQGYDVEWEAGVMAKILRGEMKPSESTLFNNGGQNYLARLFINYTNAIRDTKTVWIVYGVEGRHAMRGMYSFNTKEEAQEHLNALYTHYRKSGKEWGGGADGWVVHMQEYGGTTQ